MALSSHLIKGSEKPGLYNYSQLLLYTTMQPIQIYLIVTRYELKKKK